jgi:signal transduction histidine kinase
VAKAYVDQLERSQGLSADQIAKVRAAIDGAEKSRLAKGDVAKLRALAGDLEKSAGSAKDAADANRLRALAEIAKSPVL